MATTIQVAGPTKIVVSVPAADSILGYSDNDNLPSITFTDNQHEVKTVLSGNVPEEIVMTGTSARISVALVKWDENVLGELLAQQRGAYNYGTVGRRLTGGATPATFSLKVESVGNVTNLYEFGAVFLMSDGIVDSQWGNRERVLTLNFMAIPYTVENTTTLFTYDNGDNFTPP